MAATYETYTGNGVLTNYTIPFPYIERDDVKVYVNGVLQTSGAQYNFTSPSVIQFITAPTNGATIVVRRISEQDTRVVDFIDGAVLTEADLDLSATHLFYMIQENRDLLETIINGTFSTVGSTLLDSVAEQVLSTETALEIQSRISDIDAAGQLLLDAMMQRRVLGEPTNDYSAFVLDTTTTMVTPTESLATRLASITATAAGNAAAIITEQTVRADADSALATQITAVVASAATNAAAIVTEQTARASADSALASDITALGVTVGGHTASITTLSSAMATAEGDIVALEARYGVTLNVGGYITGFTQFNNGSSGTFSILSDKFYVVDPASGGQNPKAVFGIENGNVLLQNLYLHQLVIGDTGYIRRGKTSVSDTTNGFWFGYDGVSSYDLHIGNATQYLWWDGSAGTLTHNGTLVGTVKLTDAFSSPGTTSADLDGHDLGRHVEGSPVQATSTSAWTDMSSFTFRGTGEIAIRVTYSLDTVAETGSGDHVFPMTQGNGIRVLVNGSVVETKSIDGDTASGVFTYFYSVDVTDNTHVVLIQGRQGYGNRDVSGTYTVAPTVTAYRTYGIVSYLDNI